MQNMRSYNIFSQFHELHSHELLETQVSFFSTFFSCFNKDLQIDFHKIITKANVRAYCSHKQKIFFKILQLKFCP